MLCQIVFAQYSIVIGSLFFPYSISVSKSKLPWRQYLCYLLLSVHHPLVLSLFICVTLRLETELLVCFDCFWEPFRSPLLTLIFCVYLLQSPSHSLWPSVSARFFFLSLRITYLLPNLAPLRGSIHLTYCLLT